MTGPIEALRDRWSELSTIERARAFRGLSADDAASFFAALPTHDQADVLGELPSAEQRVWLKQLAPDDTADVLQEVDAEQRVELLELLDHATRAEVRALLAYAEDAAGGLMSTRFARLRPELTVSEAIRYLRRQAAEDLETIYYVYVLDAEQRLLGVASFRELFSAPGERRVSELMHTDVVKVRVDMDQEEVSRLVKRHDLLAVPVVDHEGRLKGIVTIDDIVDVVEEAATEDVQKIGGMEALGAPYLDTAFGEMIRKRAGWLSILFVGEMLTATAMAFFEDEIARAVVLAVFVPLIISSGGNSGSQATTLIIRAMALGEVRLRDWWRIARRELAAGVSLGVILAVIGLVRILVWQQLFGSYGLYAARIAVVVGVSLVGVVTAGTIAGSMLPFLLRRAGLDPASASAPFVATVVDVAGLVIYFSVAKAVLGGYLL